MVLLITTIGAFMSPFDASVVTIAESADCAFALLFLDFRATVIGLDYRITKDQSGKMK